MDTLLKMSLIDLKNFKMPKKSAKTLPKKSAKTKEKKLPNKGIKKLMFEKLTQKRYEKLDHKIRVKFHRMEREKHESEISSGNLDDVITSSEHFSKHGKDIVFMTHKNYPNSIFVESI